MIDIEEISGLSSGDKRLEMIQAYMERSEGDSISNEFTISDRSDCSSVESSAPVEIAAQTLIPSDDVAISFDPHKEASSVDEILQKGNEKSGNIDESSALSEAVQIAMGKALILDSDSDGIIDTLDVTGSDSLMEQWYDEEGDKAPQLKNIRAFASLMSMLSNLDLTRFDDKFTENGGDSLASMAIAGMAQVAITHSARLQKPLPNVIPKKQDIVKAIEQYKKQSDKEKRNNLIVRDRLIEAMPSTHPMKEVLQAVCKIKARNQNTTDK
ncbi:MAG: hypothetical protein LBB11_02445 [Puniceicoccales bacterium]|jgi:hypothetical protein|nr:hypothetical protein [Puniceicoccales bacterium]